MSHGRYDDVTAKLLKEHGAELVAVIVMGGDRGHGFSVSAIPRRLPQLPELLEQMAKDIRAQNATQRLDA